jgi:hypothetical protein
MMLRPVPTPGYPQTGVREALAASLQDRLWQYVLTFWANQDVEVDALRIAAKVDGLDVARLEEDAASVRITQALSRVRDRASRARAPVPSLYVDPEGKGPSDVQRVALTSEAAVLRAIGTAVSAAGPP